MTTARQYLELPEAAIYGPAPSGWDWAGREGWKDVSDQFHSVRKGLGGLSILFGLSPISRPVFIQWAGIHSPSWVKAAGDAGLLDTCQVGDGDDLAGWTNPAAPHKHYIATWERCGGQGCDRGHEGGFHGRRAGELYRTGVHEFGHRLQLAGLVDWPDDLADGRCSTAVRVFADFVSRLSSGANVMLNDNYSRGYGDLAQACRVKRGLTPHPSAGELGMGVMVWGRAVPA